MKNVLFIVDHVPSPDFYGAVTERLQSRLGVTVRTKSSDSGVGKDAIDADLILVCSRTVSPGFVQCELRLLYAKQRHYAI
jgi:hypothetical protein